MYKKILILAFLLSSFFSFSQEVVNSIPLRLKGNRDVFQIVDNDKKEVTLFLSDKKKVNAIRLNEQMQIIDSLSSDRPDKTYDEMIGCISNGNKKKIFWASGNTKQIVLQNYDFEKRTISTDRYTLELKEERVVQKFSDNGNFYIVTVLKDSNSLKFYIFDTSDTISEKIMSLEGFNFYRSHFDKSTLYGVLDENFLPFEKAYLLQKITPESPTSLTFSSRKRKCYIHEGKFILSFDSNPDYTMLVTIDLNNFTATEKTFKSEYIQPDFYGRPELSSFLIDDKLFQIKVSSIEMVLVIKDMNNNVIKKYKTLSTEDISYKSSPMIQENGSSSNQKILEKTTPFLRKLSHSYCGISCYNVDGNYLLKIGGVTEESNNNYGLMMFGAVGAIAATALSNPTFDNFNSYANRRVVYVNSLLDSNGNPVKKEIGPIAFDKIQKYIEENTNSVSPTIFKLNNAYYLGFYQAKNKEYSFVKFID